MTWRTRTLDDVERELSFLHPLARKGNVLAQRRIISLGKWYRWRFEAINL